MIRWHRRFALIAGIAVMLWGLSGLLHPLMSWTNPRGGDVYATLGNYIHNA